MVNLSKYPVKGNCQFPNIMDQLANGRVRSVNVETGGSFIGRWRVGIKVKEIDNEMHLIPFISYKCEDYPKCRIGYYLGIKKTKHHSMKRTGLCSEWQALGFRMALSDLKPEFLDDGAIIIEYGIRVDSIKTTDNIWTFQLWTDLFDSKGKQVMIQLWEDKEIRCHPQIAAIHHDNSFETSFPILEFHEALQMAHGVRYQQFPMEFIISAIHARVMGFRNVIQYCQWQLIQTPVDDPFFGPVKLKAAQFFGMRSYLVHLIREMNSKEELMRILKELDIDTMSGESMKTFMKFLLYE